MSTAAIYHDVSAPRDVEASTMDTRDTMPINKAFTGVVGCSAHVFTGNKPADHYQLMHIRYTDVMCWLVTAASDFPLQSR